MTQAVTETIGLIGTGFMGTSILRGVLEKKIAQPERVIVFDQDAGKARAFSQERGVRKADSAAGLCRDSSLIILAVKPQDLAAAVSDCGEGLGGGRIVISILAGTPLDRIRRAAGPALRLVRAMPNLGASVGEAVTALASEDAEALASARRIFEGCGTVLELEEAHFDLVTAVSGSGPAYFFLVMEQLVRTAVEEGLDEATARALAVQTAVGAGRLAAASDDDPAELRRRVTSKGGTTEAALGVLEAEGVPEAFRRAVRAARDRGRRLGGS